MQREQGGEQCEEEVVGLLRAEIERVVRVELLQRPLRDFAPTQRHLQMRKHGPRRSKRVATSQVHRHERAMIDVCLQLETWTSSSWARASSAAPLRASSRPADAGSSCSIPARSRSVRRRHRLACSRRTSRHTRAASCSTSPSGASNSTTTGSTRCAPSREWTSSIAAPAASRWRWTGRAPIGCGQWRRGSVPRPVSSGWTAQRPGAWCQHSRRGRWAACAPRTTVSSRQRR